MEVINNVFKFLFFVIAITLNMSSPLPSLPLIIFNYIGNNFLFAFFSTITGSVFASYIQYLFAKKIYKLNEVKFFKKIQNFIKKNIGIRRNSLKTVAVKVRNSTYLDFFVLRFSSIFPFKATNLYCGLIGYPLKKFLLLTSLSQIPWNFIYYLSVKSNNFVFSDISEFKSYKLNINIFKIPFINLIYSITFIYIISRLILYLIRKYNKFIN